MLSQTLKTLEADGLVSRTDHATSPPRVDYALTAPGDQVARAVVGLISALYAVLPQVLSADRPA